jgi:two-component system CheB/CheR fusion protein
MPRAAIATGLVDLVLTPPEIAQELMRIVSHPVHRIPRGETSTETTEERPTARRGSRADLRSRAQRYRRRLPALQATHHPTPASAPHGSAQADRVDRYLKLLRERPAEIQLLYQDILIHVTRFFREPESFDAITEHVLPKIMPTLRDEDPIRVWVPGCSTGEEAYSIAMVVLEYLHGATAAAAVQVFATDISDTAIEHARGGFYPQSIVSDVSPERLRRFFTKVDGGYRIIKAVRDTCIFARQDLTRDPPFSKLDLIVCRNVLIYMGSELQKRVMNVFHYALKPTGFLVLGAAETIGPHSDLFGVADKKHRIHQKKPASVGEVRFPLEYTAAAPLLGRQPTAMVREESKRRRARRTASSRIGTHPSGWSSTAIFISSSSVARREHFSSRLPAIRA